MKASSVSSMFTKRFAATAATFTLVAVFAATSLSVAEESDKALFGRLKGTKHSLADGINQAQKQNGVAISAKFEMDGNTLMLSVYTAKAGLGHDAEHNTLIELSGDAAKATWTPKSEVFEDKEHLTRSAMQLTLVQLSKLTLTGAIKKAAAAQRGTIYSVIPSVRGGSPVYDVKVWTPEGKSVQLIVNGLSGKVSR